MAKKSKKKNSKSSVESAVSSNQQEANIASKTGCKIEKESFAERFGWQGALLCIVFLLGCFSVANADIWWHLRTGELILEKGSIPQTDWFTYTNPDAEWIDLHWGFQIIAATLFKIGGPGALVFFKSLIAVLTFGVCLTIGRRDLPVWQNVMIWLAPVLIFAGRYYVRPEILSLCFFACTLAILHHSLKKPRLLWLLPLVQILWVNVQGLFVLQFVVMGCFFVDQIVRRVFPGICGTPSLDSNDSADFKGRVDLKKFSIASGVSVLASLLNPYGFRGATFPIVLFRKVRGEERTFFYQFASELEGIDTILERSGLALLSDLTPLLMLLMTIAIVISFFALFVSGKGINVYRLLLIFGFAYLTWSMSRNSTFYAIVGGMILRLNFGEIAETFSLETQKYRIPKILLAVCLGTLILIIPMNIYSQLRPSFVPRAFGFGMADWYPHQACRFIKSNEKKMPDKIYAWHIGCAAIAIYHLAPDKKVFADARLETNTKTTLTNFMRIIDNLGRANPNADRLLIHDSKTAKIDRTELPALLIDVPTLVQSTIQGLPLARNLIEENKWRCVYFDASAAVFVSEEFAEKHDLPKADTGFLDNFINMSKHGTLGFGN